MNATHQVFFGSGVRYDRVCLITEVLGRFVSGAPRAVDLAQLEKQSGRPKKELQRLCALLCREGLLRPHPERANSWMLACEPSGVTLEDAFRCALNERAVRVRSRDVTTEEAAHPEVDMLVMQATMGINQSIFQHLRQFSLDRLKVSAAGMFGRSAADPWSRRLSFR